MWKTFTVSYNTVHLWSKFLQPTLCCRPILSVQMRSIQSTSQSQPDFTVPVVTLDPVVWLCWWCQYLIWYSFSLLQWVGIASYAQGYDETRKELFSLNDPDFHNQALTHTHAAQSVGKQYTYTHMHMHIHQLEWTLGSICVFQRESMTAWVPHLTTATSSSPVRDATTRV